MRRLFIYLIVAILVIGALRATHHRPARHAPPPPVRWHDGPDPRDDAAYRQWVTAESRGEVHKAAAEARQALAEAGREVRHAYREARDEIGHAYREARDEIRRAYSEVLADDGRRRPLPPPPPPTDQAPALEDAEGLPVPIVPGTRVTEAEARPPVPGPTPPTFDAAGTASCPIKATQIDRFHRIVAGDICATEDRARDDARKMLRRLVAEWLTPDIPASWSPPDRLLDEMVVATKLDSVAKPYGLLYTAELTADFSPRRRAELVETYNRELVRHRLLTIAGVLAFVLVCLAALSGYIRADEATQGYYTNRLRMLTAAGVGAAGVVVYRMLA